MQTNVLAFDRVKDAYECLMEKEIDLFVVDIILDKSVQGDSSGLRFVDNVRRVTRYAFTPVIFVTSLEDSRLYTYEKLHCYSFVENPYADGTMFGIPGKGRDAEDALFQKGRNCFSA